MVVILSGLHAAPSGKMILFITTAVRTSDPTLKLFVLHNEVLSVRCAVLSVVIPLTSGRNQRCGGKYRLYFQCRRENWLTASVV
jgi:hypothetical protein